MHPTLELFNITIPTYFLFSTIGIAFAIGFALLRRRTARFHTSAEDVFFTLLCCIIGALVGAKAFQLIGSIVLNGGDAGFWTLKNWKGMLPGVGVFYGGLIGGFAAALIYIQKNKLDFWDVIDILIPSVLLFHAFGRVGCFFAGCCYGREVTWSIAINGLVPVQLFEAGLNLLLLAAVLIIRPERKRPGILLPLYLITYSIGRFILEFFRGDTSRGMFFLSTSQWLSLLVLPVGILLLIWNGKDTHLTAKKKGDAP